MLKLALLDFDSKGTWVISPVYLRLKVSIVF